MTPRSFHRSITLPHFAKQSNHTESDRSKDTCITGEETHLKSLVPCYARSESKGTDARRCRAGIKGDCYVITGGKVVEARVFVLERRLCRRSSYVNKDRQLHLSRPADTKRSSTGSCPQRM